MKTIGVGIIGASPLNPGWAVNAHIPAQIYAQFAKDIHEGTHVVPGFAHAVSRHRLLDAIETASRTGVTQKLG